MNNLTNCELVKNIIYRIYNNVFNIPNYEEIETFEVINQHKLIINYQNYLKNIFILLNSNWFNLCLFMNDVNFYPKLLKLIKELNSLKFDVSNDKFHYCKVDIYKIVNFKHITFKILNNVNHKIIHLTFKTSINEDLKTLENLLKDLGYLTFDKLYNYYIIDKLMSQENENLNLQYLFNDVISKQALLERHIRKLKFEIDGVKSVNVKLLMIVVCIIFMFMCVLIVK